MEAYKIFYTVADCGSISLAAKRLYVTQPAVSKAIKNLETSLEVNLFHRTSKGVHLTHEGTKLYGYVKEAFYHLEEGKKAIGLMKSLDEGVIKIGISNTLCKYFFIPHLEVFHQTYPKLKIEVINRTSSETMVLLKEGRIDCAVISEMAVGPKLWYQKLMIIEDIFVTKSSTEGPPIPLENLKSHSMLLLEKGNATRAYLDRFLMEHQVALNVEIEISSMEFLIEFAKIGLGTACVIKEFVKEDLKHNKLSQIETAPKIPKRSIGLITRRNVTISIACNTFIDFMLDPKSNKRDNGSDH